MTHKHDLIFKKLNMLFLYLAKTHEKELDKTK
jgi:hypothetical protein